MRAQVIVMAPLMIIRRTPLSKLSPGQGRGLVHVIVFEQLGGTQKDDEGTNSVLILAIATTARLKSLWVTSSDTFEA